ncbi:MAG: hypothetical protein HY055_04770 [Magnetospirillum sp.]|nr:hypothetical protein [Magnetospirillum sp.]
MIKTVLLSYIRAVLGLLGRPVAPRTGWRSLEGEVFVVPLGEIHRQARPEGRAARLQALLAPVANLLGREPARKAKAGQVSGVYYPID